MLIDIHTDGATIVRKEVTEDQAADYASKFTVKVVNEDGTTSPYGVAEPAAESTEDAAPPAAKKVAAKKISKKK